MANPTEDTMATAGNPQSVSSNSHAVVSLPLCPPIPLEAANAQVATARARPGPQDVGRWVLAATILGSSMGFIDGTAVNVALPILQRDLGATVADTQWVVESYTLFLASLTLVGGALG